MTLQFVVELIGEIVVDGHGVPEDRAAMIEQHLDEVMDELIKLGATDPSIDLDLGTRCVVMSVVVNEPNPVNAVGTASTLMRTAIHAAGGGTPDWPEQFDEAWAIRLDRVTSESVPATDSDAFASA